MRELLREQADFLMLICARARVGNNFFLVGLVRAVPLVVRWFWGDKELFGVRFVFWFFGGATPEIFHMLRFIIYFIRREGGCVYLVGSMNCLICKS